MENLIGKTIQANYFRGAEAVGGHITFDATGFVFRSHSLNIQTGETRINYDEIVSISKRNTLGLVPNGLSVFTRSGFEHKFVVYHRSSIMDFLNSRIIAAGPTPPPLP
ncbi:MAG: hypothetical protein LKF31_06890 [Muribaculaceae bacterium]|jgi:glycine/serine hydroxymethyltransferase|nr:hypothetical protein [Muribaculaceae bacterium]